MPALVSLGGTYTNNNYGSFYNMTTLQSVSIGPNCTNIAAYTFRGCTALTTFVIKATTPPTIGTGLFQSTHAALKIYVPYSADHSILAAYQAATNWSAYASQIYELDENGEIPT